MIKEWVHNKDVPHYTWMDRQANFWRWLGTTKKYGWLLGVYYAWWNSKHHTHY